MNFRFLEKMEYSFEEVVKNNAHIFRKFFGLWLSVWWMIRESENFSWSIIRCMADNMVDGFKNNYVKLGYWMVPSSVEEQFKEDLEYILVSYGISKYKVYNGLKYLITQFRHKILDDDNFTIEDTYSLRIISHRGGLYLVDMDKAIGWNKL